MLPAIYILSMEFKNIFKKLNNYPDDLPAYKIIIYLQPSLFIAINNDFGERIRSDKSRKPTDWERRIQNPKMASSILKIKTE